MGFDTAASTLADAAPSVADAAAEAIPAVSDSIFSGGLDFLGSALSDSASSGYDNLSSLLGLGDNSASLGSGIMDAVTPSAESGINGIYDFASSSMPDSLSTASNGMEDLASSVGNGASDLSSSGASIFPSSMSGGSGILGKLLGQVPEASSKMDQGSFLEQLAKQYPLDSGMPDASGVTDAASSSPMQDSYATLKALTNMSSGAMGGYGNGITLPGASTGLSLGEIGKDSGSGISNLFGNMKVSDMLKGAGSLASLYSTVKAMQDARKPLSQNSDALQPAKVFLVGNSLSTPTTTTYANRGKSLESTTTGKGFAKGGALGTLTSSPRLIQGPGGGQGDKVPMRGSPGEYVMDADVVSSLGDGNNAEGARKLDTMRQNIRKQKRAAPTNKIPPKAKKPESYLG